MPRIWSVVTPEAISRSILSAIKSGEQILRATVSYPFSKYDFFPGRCKKRYYPELTVYFVVRKLFWNWLPDSFYSVESLLLSNSLSIGTELVCSACLGSGKIVETEHRIVFTRNITMGLPNYSSFNIPKMIVTILRIRPCNSLEIESIFSCCMETFPRATFFLHLTV